LAVTDGDTILRAVVNDRNERIRLIGVDAPEIEYEAQPGGQEAQKFARARLTQRTVWLEMDVLERDHHGRLLAYVWLRRLTLVNEALVRRHMFNAQLLLEGHAQAVTIPPNVRYSGMFAEFQQEAEAAEKEMWKKR
jgi:micrococcal nuclease